MGGVDLNVVQVQATPDSPTPAEGASAGGGPQTKGDPIKNSTAGRFIPAMGICMVYLYLATYEHGPLGSDYWINYYNGSHVLTPIGTLWDDFFARFWPMTLAMILGSLIAGSTPLGGGVVAFPVAVLVIGFKPADGRDFTVLIQTVGMNCAAYLICVYKRHLVDFDLCATFVMCGIPGVLLGLAMDLPPFFVMLTFQILVLEFAVVFFYLNVLSPRTSPSAVPTHQMHTATETTSAVTSTSDEGANAREPARGPSPTEVEAVDSALAKPQPDSVMSRTTARFAMGSMALASFAGGFLTANVGSGSDIMLYAYGLLGWNLIVPKGRRLNDTQLTASSVVVMGLMSLVTAVCRGFTGQIASDTLYCWGATAWLVCFGAPLGSLLLTPGLRAQLRITFYIIAIAQFIGFAVLKIGVNAVAWIIFGSVTAALLVGLVLHYAHAKRTLDSSGCKVERLSISVVKYRLIGTD